MSNQRQKMTINRTYKILIADLVGMRFDQNDQPDHSETQAYIEAKGGIFHHGSQQLAKPVDNANLDTPNPNSPKLHFFYQPNLSTESELLQATADGQYDAVIAAATLIPEACQFAFGGVRIGAGTGNMACASWGGGSGQGGLAPLMNTPGFNSQATAQAAIKALLKVMPDLNVTAMHQRVVAGDFDTGKDLVQYPTEKISSKTIAILGYGHIGREMAKLAKAFGMTVRIFARARHKTWILSQGYAYADTIIAAATGADVISPHLGLGVFDQQKGDYVNAGVIDKSVFAVMKTPAVLINYDRGELVDIHALDQALANGQIRYAAIDADIFKDSDSGEVSGPMKPYLAIYPAHSGKLELLPHAAADTEHHSRVAGAKQAVEQIFDVILHRKVVNLKGDLPPGYTDGKALTVTGIGQVTTEVIAGLGEVELKDIADKTKQLAKFWGALDDSKDTEGYVDLIERDGAEATRVTNQLLVLFAQKGLLGPYG